MTSASMRDPVADHLLTPQNTAFLLIDYQPQQLVARVRSMDRALLAKNAVSTVRIVKTFGSRSCTRPSTSPTAGNSQSLPELADLLTDDSHSPDHDQLLGGHRIRPGRPRDRPPRLIICALWTEMCMAFAALDALCEGYTVYPVVDAIGGTSPEAHRAGLDRVIQAGGQPISWVSLAGELLRDWARRGRGDRRDHRHRPPGGRSNNAPRQPRLAASLTAKKSP